MTLFQYYELKFSGDISSLNHLKEKILELLKNKEKNCIQFLRGEDFKIPEDGYICDGYKNYYDFDYEWDDIDYSFNTDSIILKFGSFSVAPVRLYYISDICVKYLLNCKMDRICADTDQYDYIYFTKNGKGKGIFCSYDHGNYIKDPSITFKNIESNLLSDVCNNRTNINIWDKYLERYYYLNQKDKIWMVGLINDAVSVHSGEVLFNL